MIDWNDNAKAAVREFAYYIGESDKGERYLEHVAPKKTVADAVEYFDGIWPKPIMGSPPPYEEQVIIYCTDSTQCGSKVGEYYAGGCHFDSSYFYQVCTRAEFEAHVKEQESEKWTHVYTDDTGTDIRCVLLAEHGEWVWVKDAGTVDTICKSWLKPIKPTISEDAVSKLRAYANWTAGQESGYVSELIEEFIATHDII